MSNKIQNNIDATVTSQYSISDPNIKMVAYSKSSRQEDPL